MQHWHNRLAPSLQQLKKRAAYRQRRILHSAQAASVSVDNQHLLNFSSNDYLGLANHPEVAEAFTSAAEKYGVGSGASHLVVGHHELHHQLENALADYTGRDRALLFSSGYMANLGVLGSLMKSGDVIFGDKLNHASLIDGGLSSAAKLMRYRHRDIEHLNTLIKANLKNVGMIVTDSVFSMDGDVAPLDQLADIASEHNVVLMVDDAHAFGVLGETGAGSAEHFDLSQQQLPVVMGTLGKAIGVMGAFIAGSEELIETLIQSARNYIYTTALPPACAAAALAALHICKNEPERRTHLMQLATHFQRGCDTLGLALSTDRHSEVITPIQPVFAGSNEIALALSNHLYQKGVLVAAIRPPTVPEGTARLRVSLSAAHSIKQVDALLDALESGGKKLGLIP